MDGRQPGVPVKTSLYHPRYRIQLSLATHGTDRAYLQRLVVAGDVLSPGIRLYAPSPSPQVMPPWLGVSGVPCPNDAAGYLRTTSSRGDPPGTVGLRMVAVVPKSIVGKDFRLS